MSKAKQLYELQEIDLEIDHSNQSLSNLRSQLGKDDDLNAARADLETARKRLADLEHQQRTAEWGVDDLQAKITKEEKRLYEGSVKNPRELMSLQQEISHLKEQRGEQDDQVLAVMLEVDTVQQDINDRSNELEELERNWKEDQERIQKEIAVLEADVAALEKNREPVLDRLDPASIGMYAELRKTKQGRAVAKVKQSICQGCRISLPVSDQQRARIGQELVKCSNCGRILYAE